MTGLLAFSTALFLNSSNFPVSQAILNHLDVSWPIRICSAFGDLKSESNQQMVANLHRDLQATFFVNFLQEIRLEENDYRLASTIILLMDDAFSVDFIVNNTLRNHETLYIALCLTFECVKERLDEFSSARIISANVLFLEDSDVKIFGYEPMPDQIKVLEKTHIEVVGIFNSHSKPVNVSVVNLPPAVILNEINDMTAGGVEGLIMMETARKFNVEPHFALPQDGEWWGWVHPPAGVVGELMCGYSDFGFGILAITDGRTKVIDQLVGYGPMECVTWAVPKGAGPASAPWIAMLLTEFTKETWIAMACSTLAIIASSLIVERKTIGSTLFRIFASSIGAPIHLPTNFPQRILILTWTWSSLILAVAYTASMGSKLAVPPENPDINTYQELVNSPLTITGFYNSIRLIKGEDPLLKIIAQRSVPTTSTITEAFARIVSKRDIAYMRQGTTFRYNAIVDPDAQEGIHIMKDCAIKYYPAINLAKWSPFYRGTASVVLRLFESGLTDLWSKRLMPQLPELSHPPAALGSNKLFGAYAVLGIGLGTSLIVFTGEIIFGRRVKVPQLQHK